MTRTDLACYGARVGILDQLADRLSPGDEVHLDEYISAPSPIQPDDVWRANRHRYELYAALLESGDRVLAPRRSVAHPITADSVSDSSYLRRLAGESSESGHGDAGGYVDEWRRRRDASAHHPLAAQILHTYVDTLARQSIDRREVERVLGADIMADVDLCGSPAHAWVMASYLQGLAHGWGVALVDTPRELAAMPSRYHEIHSGARPWVTWWSPMRIWRLELGPHREILDITLRESRTRWRRWTATGWLLYDERGEVIDRGDHGFGRVPAALFIADDPSGDDATDPPGLSAMRATALLDLQILHHASLLDDVVSKTGYPFYHLRLDPDDNAGVQSDLKLGAGSIFAVEAEGDWKAPPGDLAQTLMAYLDWLEGRIYKISGVHRRSQDSVEAHSGLALDWENAPIYATVLRWAQRVQAWETAVWRLMAIAAGSGDGSGIEVAYPDDLSTRPVEQDLAYAERIVQLYSGSPPPWVRVVADALVRRAALRLVGHISDVRAAIPAKISLPEEQAPPPAPPGQSDDDDGGDDADTEGEGENKDGTDA